MNPPARTRIAAASGFIVGGTQTSSACPVSVTQPTPERRQGPGARRLEEAGFLPVRSLLPRPILSYLKVYFRILMTNGRLRQDPQAPRSLSIGGDAALDAMLDFVGPEVARRVGRDLAPTYSYARIYMQGDRLEPHTDRPACEVSVSICVATPPGARPSRLCFRRQGEPDWQVSMREGDACIYLGTEVEHWRDPFPEGGHIQLFLHFIDQAGPYFPALRFDGRPRLGAASSAAPTLTAGSNA